MEINIKENGISIKHQVYETYYDKHRRPVQVPVANHRVSVGIGDFAQDVCHPTPQELNAFRAKIDELAMEIYGKPLAKAIADFAIVVNDQQCAAQ